MTELKVKSREKDVNLKRIRRQGIIPAIVYSRGQAGLNLAVDYMKFNKVYEDAGESSLVDLVFDDGKNKKVLIHEIQREPVTNKIIHIDFYEVDLTKKVTTNVELEFVGEAPVVKNEGGIVIKKLDEIEIECLPLDLIKKFKVDISVLTDFSSVIHIRDLKISDRITILNNPDDIVVNVAEPKTEAQEAPAAPVEGEDGAEGGAEAKEAGEKEDGKNEKSEGGGKEKEKKSGADKK